ncbi:MAG: type III polyketide synthase [Trueperaceae bacterium]
MDVHLHHVATAVPPFAYDQATAHRVMRDWIGGDRRTDLLLRRIYGASGIDRRHSVVGDFVASEGADVPLDPPPAEPGDAATPPLYLLPDGTFRDPGTAERNDRYREEARRLFVGTAHDAVDGPHPFGPEDVTHLITVSCTGFYAPGPDLDVVHGLGLRPTVERYHLGFMGCYAAFPALRMARAFCRAEPDAVVLVVLVELCSLHLRPSRATDDVIAASVFADGAAAMVVSARAPSGPTLALDRFVDGLAPEGASDMAWTIGDHGFAMTLSAYVPRIVGEKAAFALAPLLEGTGVEPAHVPRWALHPGGRAIVDSVQRGMDLPEGAVADARAVLAAYGNMSSVTVPFVLARLLRDPGPEDEPVLALAFGPGLTVATGLLRWRHPDGTTAARTHAPGGAR